MRSTLTSHPSTRLMGIRLLHTAVWAFFAGCILLLPFSAWIGRFDWAAWQAGLVLLECGVLGLNRFRCPLTDWAAKFTDDRAPNFDIYLPRWMAQHNQQIFGTLFIFNGLATLALWLRSHRGN